MLIKALEQERNTLRQEGYDLGEKDGIEQGLEQGLEQGKLVAQRQTLLRLVQ
jgi:flagellar biosynthesis/type III secretory pathway protein FliH